METRNEHTCFTGNAIAQPIESVAVEGHVALATNVGTREESRQGPTTERGS